VCVVLIYRFELQVYNFFPQETLQRLIVFFAVTI
jgi:hypothetical protein